jgi:transcriptional regulator with GAF, ATPase, and Fis domain
MNMNKNDTAVVFIDPQNEVLNVTEPGNSRNVPFEPSDQIAAAPLESIVCTQELRNRPSRPPEYEKENRALAVLASALADSPRTILQTLADKVFEVLQADSAGLSLLTKDGKRFYWAAVAGAWGPHVGAHAPRSFGPCGDVLDHNGPMLFAHWERRYPYLSWAMPLADEGLLVPFYVNGKAVGTIWAVAHDHHRKFDAEDLRLLESLGRFASAAHQAVALIDDLKVQIAEREKAEAALHELTDGLEMQVRVRTAELEQRNEEVKKLRDRLYKENIALREEIDKVSMFEEIVGASPALRKVLSSVTKVALTDSTVLITGETGTGKELIARAIHKTSRRSSRAFVSVNCSAIPLSLIASELFGHEKGAFTGALQQRLGRFELAEGGTIFLDEIGDLPWDTQNTLLRVLQEHEFERVGGTQTIRADVRVVAATNRDLMSAMAAGTFRSDLFYRLNVFPIETPSLRERKEDIPMLVEYFIKRYASKAGKKIKSINKKSLELLQRYSWPGNIRELQNVIERSVIFCETETLVIDENWLPRNTGKTPPLNGSLSEELLAQEKAKIEAALAETRGRVSGPSGAAAKLRIPPSTLDSKIRSLKINPHRFKIT